MNKLRSGELSFQEKRLATLGGIPRTELSVFVVTLSSYSLFSVVLGVVDVFFAFPLQCFCMCVTEFRVGLVLPWFTPTHRVRVYSIAL